MYHFLVGWTVHCSWTDIDGHTEGVLMEMDFNVKKVNSVYKIKSRVY